MPRDPSEPPASDLDPVWRALANPLRREMLDRLQGGPLSTGDLVLAFPDLSRFAVMQHLGVLEEAGLVIAHKLGRTRLNFLNVVPIRRIYERWVSQYEEQWADTLIDLKGRLEQRGERGISELRRSPSSSPDRAAAPADPLARRRAGETPQSPRTSSRRTSSSDRSRNPDQPHTTKRSRKHA